MSAVEVTVKLTWRGRQLLAGRYVIGSVDGPLEGGWYASFPDNADDLEGFDVRPTEAEAKAAVEAAALKALAGDQ